MQQGPILKAAPRARSQPKQIPLATTCITGGCPLKLDLGCVYYNYNDPQAANMLGCITPAGTQQGVPIPMDTVIEAAALLITTNVCNPPVYPSYRPLDPELPVVPEIAELVYSLQKLVTTFASSSTGLFGRDDILMGTGNRSFNFQNQDFSWTGVKDFSVLFNSFGHLKVNDATGFEFISAIGNFVVSVEAIAMAAAGNISLNCMFGPIYLNGFVHLGNLPNTDPTKFLTTDDQGLTKLVAIPPPIPPTLANTQVGFGSGSNMLTGSPDLTWDNTTKRLKATGDLQVTGRVFDSTNSPGTANQMLTSTVTGTLWKPVTATPDFDAVLLAGNIAYNKNFYMRNGAGQTIIETSVNSFNGIIFYSAATPGKRSFFNADTFAFINPAGYYAYFNPPATDYTKSQVLYFPNLSSLAGAAPSRTMPVSVNGIFADTAGDITLSIPLPSLTTTQVGFGSGTNLLTGSPDLTWNNTTKKLTATGDMQATGKVLDSAGAAGTANQVLTSTVTGTQWKVPVGGIKSIGINLDGQGLVLTTGQKGYIRIPYAGTITGWSIISDISGSCVFDIWKAAGVKPTVANTITAAAKPTLTAADLIISTTLTGWTTAVAAGDIIGWNLDSISTITRAILQLTIQPV